jgi:hypothetical protein
VAQLEVAYADARSRLHGRMPGGFHIALRMRTGRTEPRMSGSSGAEVDALRERLASFGIAASPPVQQPWGHYSTTARDPNHLEVVLYCQVTN